MRSNRRAQVQLNCVNCLASVAQILCRTVLGQLQLRHLALTVPESRNIAGCEAKVGDDVQAVLFKQEKDRVEVTFAEPLLLSAGAALRVQLTWQ